MKNIKDLNQGITLVALVITVIIMLIMAGVVFLSMGGADGFLTKSEEIADDYQQKTEEEENKVGILEDMVHDQSKAPLGRVPFIENQTYNGLKEGTYDNPIIPRGFYPINENGAIWGTEDGYKKGLVIEDIDENQYVWIPVDGTNVKFERVDWKYPEGHSNAGASIANGTYSSYKDPTLPSGMQNSVTTNQGFYIARFEAGVSEDMKEAIKIANNGTEVTALTSDTTTTYGTGTYKPVSKQDAVVWNYIKYKDGSGNGANLVSNSLYPENSKDYGVVSTLIYGVQWDTALSFIGAYNVGEEGYDTYATTSYGMGNYSGTSGGDTSTAGPDVSGALDAFRQKNIYDMAGNLYEWSSEKCGDRWVNRGGTFTVSSNTPAAARYNRKYTSSANYLGFRVALYIKTTIESGN